MLLSGVEEPRQAPRSATADTEKVTCGVNGGHRRASACFEAGVSKHAAIVAKQNTERRGLPWAATIAGKTNRLCRRHARPSAGISLRGAPRHRALPQRMELERRAPVPMPVHAALMQGVEQARATGGSAHLKVSVGAAANLNAPRDSVLVRRSRTLPSPTPVGRLTPETVFRDKIDPPSSRVNERGAARLGSEVWEMEESRQAAQDAQAATASWQTQRAASKAASVKTLRVAARATEGWVHEQQTNAWTRQTAEKLKTCIRRERDLGQRLQHQGVGLQQWREESGVVQVVSDFQANYSSAVKPGEDPKYTPKKIQRRQLGDLISIKATIVMLYVGGTMAQMKATDIKGSQLISEGLFAFLLIGVLCFSYGIGWTLSSTDKCRWMCRRAVVEQLLILMICILSIVMALTASFGNESYTRGRDYTALLFSMFRLVRRVKFHAMTMLKMWNAKHVLLVPCGVLERHFPRGSKELLRIMVKSIRIVKNKDEPSKALINGDEVFKAWDATKFQELRLSEWRVELKWSKKQVIASIAGLLEKTLHYTGILDDNVYRWMKAFGCKHMYKHFVCTLAVKLLHTKGKLFAKYAKFHCWEHKIESIEKTAIGRISYSRSWLSRIREMKELQQIVEVHDRTIVIWTSTSMECTRAQITRFVVILISMDTISHRQLQEGQRQSEQCLGEPVQEAAETRKKCCVARVLGMKTLLNDGDDVAELVYQWIITVGFCVKARLALGDHMRWETKGDQAAHWAVGLIVCRLEVC